MSFRYSVKLLLTTVMLVLGFAGMQPAAMASADDTIVVQFYNANTNTDNDEIDANFRLINTGTTDLRLADVKLRYYYTVDGAKAQIIVNDWSSVGAANMTSAIVTMPSPVTDADTYAEFGFTDDAGILAPGATVELKTRIYKFDRSKYNQSNDYSFNLFATDYVDYPRVTAYVAGVLKWGTPPEAMKAAD